jgi:hypothetical protein
MCRATLAVMALAAATFGLTAAAGAAPAGAAERPTKFEGSCKLTGDISFSQPIGNVPSSPTFTDSATGTCTGMLNDRPIHELPVVNNVKGSGTLSCLGGQAHTVDTLVFAHRSKLRIYTDALLAGTEAVAHSRGAISGDSVEHVTFQADQATLAACQAGTLRTAHYDLDAQTITPLVG